MYYRNSLGPTAGFPYREEVLNYDYNNYHYGPRPWAWDRTSSFPNKNKHYSHLYLYNENNNNFTTKFSQATTYIKKEKRDRQDLCERTLERVKRKEISRLEYVKQVYDYSRRYNHKARNVLNLIEKRCIPGNWTHDLYEGCAKHSIYILVSPRSNKYYIGRTNNLKVRDYKHKLDARACNNGKAKSYQRAYAHRFMGNTTPESWVTIPIWTNIEEKHIKRTEKVLIKRFSPPLNTQFLRDHYYKDYTTRHVIRNEKTNRRRKPHRPRKKARLLTRQRFQGESLEPGITTYTIKSYNSTKPQRASYVDTRAMTSHRS